MDAKSAHWRLQSRQTCLPPVRGSEPAFVEDRYGVSRIRREREPHVVPVSAGDELARARALGEVGRVDLDRGGRTGLGREQRRRQAAEDPRGAGEILDGDAEGAVGPPLARGEDEDREVRVLVEARGDL